MDIKDAIRVFGVSLVCVIMFVVGLKGCTAYNESVVLLSLCIVAMIVSGVAFMSTLIKFFSKKEKGQIEEISDKELESRIEKCISKGGNHTRKYAMNMKRQLQTFDKRKKVLSDLLNDNFGDDDNLYAYTNLIDKAQRTLRDNILSGIRRMSIFDEREYSLMLHSQGNYSEEVKQTRIKQYEEHIEYIKKAVDSNDKMLIEFDNLITEVSRLNESDSANDLSILKDTVNAMKQLHFSEEDDGMTELMGKY